MEMEQLLSMGFPKELAAQALAATGGNSTLRATEWILSRSSPSPSPSPTKSHSENNNPNPSLPSPPPPSKEYPKHPDIINPSPPPDFQPRLERFFHCQSKADSFGPATSIPTAATFTPHQQSEPQRDPSDEGKRHIIDTAQESSKSESKRPKLVASTTFDSPSPSFYKINKTTAIDHKSRNNNNNGYKPQPHHVPLSESMRPRTIDDVVGQDHLLAPNSLLRSAINCNRLPSIILWGPPGTGKTSIAKAIVNSLPAPSPTPSPQQLLSASSSSSSALPFYRFVSLSAVTCGVKDVKDAVDDARKIKLKKNGKRTVLFVDEVHRFNKSQQDSFLPFIEDGSIVFMGATTENPSFHLITPLLSRCRVLTLSPLKPHHVRTILTRAIHDEEVGLPKSLELQVQVSDDAIQFLSTNSDGDARVALNALEISATTAASRLLNADLHSNLDMAAIVALDDAKEALQCKHLAYDKSGEEHYNLISALHKSMRGSDADASIYWLARMLEGGEQPLYIARRLIRFASEDVGLADPSALNQAVACYQACHFLGMPECNVILAQCVAYLALAPKSISVYRAIEAAQKVVRESIGQNEGVPLHLRNAPTKLMKELGYGKGYVYTPDDPSSTQSYLPPSLQVYKFLDWPGNNASSG